MVGNNVSYIKAYTEFNCLLKYLPQSYIEKLPKKLIELIQSQSNEKYNINIDTNKNLLEQGFSKKTKDLIAVIKYNYWSTDEEKQQLKKVFYENENKHQKKLLEQYNYNENFKKNKQKIERTQEIDNNTQMIETNGNIFKIFLKKIRSLFKRK